VEAKISEKRVWHFIWQISWTWTEDTNQYKELTKILEKFETFYYKFQNNMAFKLERLYDNLIKISATDLDIIVRCLLNTKL
jgi:hypothetical protein